MAVCGGFILALIVLLAAVSLVLPFVLRVSRMCDRVSAELSRVLRASVSAVSSIAGCH